MGKVVAVIDSCRDCPNREYDSGGVYRCRKGGGELEANCTIPAWCPLQNYPTPTTAAQRVTIAENFAAHDWVDDYLNSIAGVIKAAEASIYGSAR